uniref:Secreted protein n=1 Tax=Cryptococcus bacillisporus CA1280 TaxID=1296109 RepID=A0A0D0V9K4_CRYGA|nr:hypothetical protein I312_06591 [Cryptococcus bacillisporus CA1280]
MSPQMSVLGFLPPILLQTAVCWNPAQQVRMEPLLLAPPLPRTLLPSLRSRLSNNAEKNERSKRRSSLPRRWVRDDSRKRSFLGVRDGQSSKS